MNRVRGAVALGAAVLLAAGCGANEQQELEARQKDAARVCRDAVEKLLKSPGSAEYSDEVYDGDPNESMKVTGKVDSQNSFGALVRNEWTCTVTSVGDQWSANADLTTNN